MKTANCIACGNPAVSWSGHVHNNSQKLTAGMVCGRQPYGDSTFSRQSAPTI